MVIRASDRGEGELNVAAERVAPVTAPRTGLKRGRTWILAGGDLLALVFAYATTYAVAAQVGDLPPVSAPSWFLVSLAVVAVPAWIAVFTAYHLYENDNLQISVASFDEVGTSSTPCSPARCLPRARAGPSPPRRLVGVLARSRRRCSWSPRWCSCRSRAASIRSWVFPRLMQPRRALIVGERRGGEARPAQARGPPRVRAGGRRLRRRPEDGELRPDPRRAERRRRGRRRARDRPGPARLLGREPRGDARPACAPCAAPTSSSRSSRATSSCSRPTRRSRTSRACRSSRCRRCGSARSSRAAQARLRHRASPALALVLLSPLLAAIALAIRLDSPGRCLLPPAAPRPRRLRRSGSSSSARCSSAPRSSATAVRHLNEVDGAALQGRRPATRASPGSARFLRRDEPRRAAAALERPAGRHEPRRPAALRGLRGRPDHRLGEPPARHHAGHHRASGRCSAATTSRSTRWSSSTTST